MLLEYPRVGVGLHARLGIDLEGKQLVRFGVDAEEDLAVHLMALSELSYELEIAGMEIADNLGDGRLRLLDGGVRGVLPLGDDRPLDSGLAADRDAGVVLLGLVGCRCGGVDGRFELTSFAAAFEASGIGACKDFLGGRDSVAGRSHLEDELGFQLLRSELRLGLEQSASGPACDK